MPLYNKQRSRCGAESSGRAEPMGYMGQWHDGAWALQGWCFPGMCHVPAPCPSSLLLLYASLSHIPALCPYPLFYPILTLTPAAFPAPCPCPTSQLCALVPCFCPVSQPCRCCVSSWFLQSKGEERVPAQCSVLDNAELFLAVSCRAVP